MTGAELWIRSRGIRSEHDYRWLNASDAVADTHALVTDLPEEVLSGEGPLLAIGQGTDERDWLFIGGLPRADGRREARRPPILVDLLLLGPARSAWIEFARRVYLEPEALTLDEFVVLKQRSEHGFGVTLTAELLLPVQGDQPPVPQGDQFRAHARFRRGHASEAFDDLLRLTSLPTASRPADCTLLFVLSDLVTDEWLVEHPAWRVVSDNVMPGRGAVMPDPKEVPRGVRGATWALVFIVVLLIALLVAVLA